MTVANKNVEYESKILGKLSRYPQESDIHTSQAARFDPKSSC